MAVLDIMAVAENLPHASPSNTLQSRKEERNIYTYKRVGLNVKRFRKRSDYYDWKWQGNASRKNYP